MFLALLLVVFALIGFIAARLAVLAFPLLVWGCFFAGVAADLWGNGFGDAWEAAVALTVGASVAATAAGIAIRRALDELRRSRIAQR